jgi:hypothetical protein
MGAAAAAVMGAAAAAVMAAAAAPNPELFG